MFIDDKVKEFIEHERKEWQASKEIWEKIKDEIKRNKELNKYISTYENDFLHQELKKDFDKVLDNIESLANTFNFKTGIEIISFLGYLIHCGYLSVTSEYVYNKNIVDIKEFCDDKTLNCALKIFSGFGSCRHIASFNKKTLDRFNIKNSIAPVNCNIEDYSICAIRLFLHNFHKKATGTNHVINYIEENNYHYFFDITSSQAILYGAYNGFACSVDGPLVILALYSYSYSLWNDEFIDYRKVPLIKREEVDHLIDITNTTIRKCKANQDLFVEFSLQNIENYRNITENYNKVYEKEKSLNLIKK